MLWEDEDKKVECVPQDKVVDLSFKIKCKQVPTMHAWELSQALFEALPWLADEPLVAIHQIHGATSGNGWERPPDGELIHLSKRTRMDIRIPKQRRDDAMALIGKVLDIAGYSLEVGEPIVKSLNPLGVIFSRYVAVPEGLDEDAFMEWAVSEIRQSGVTPRKMLCGIAHTIHTPDRAIETRSLMIADLDKASSISLQEQGIGPDRHLGCGIFMPHKGIRAVGETEEKSHYSGT